MASNVRETGTVRVWNPDRGFGFVRRADGSDLFLHIKAFPRETPDPEVGAVVTFEVEAQPDGKLRAARARNADEIYIPPVRPTSPILGALAILAFTAIYLLVELNWGPVPLWVLFVYLGLSVITFGSYAIDKSAARLKRRRVAETTLILLGMFGGWPGAILAQQLLRHKTAKLSFRAVFWVSVLINVFVFVALNAPGVAQSIADVFVTGE
ncbi:MAG TPA: DUF1294 domain-containing protein [Pseudolysinimonas sp.]|jgi:uncharacterized membrane protein YsdA (DUF1294 family)/cold shock CspA family protein|nr:DUF1294 domain-containing protein [Pseudolysinimonas sp.]